MNKNLIFLKLGGSLITDKDSPHTARLSVIRRLAQEIKQALDEQPGFSLVLGHGSGSFAHVPAASFGTRDGVNSPEDWRGFVEVWKEARALNQIVMEACLDAGLPVIAFPPSATVLSDRHTGTHTGLAQLQAALRTHLIPVVYGDVIFDASLGGTIFSTEEVFLLLVDPLKPGRILLAGRENGVYQDFENRADLIGVITPESYKMIAAAAEGSASVDVTGGMRKKVDLMVSLVSEHPEVSAQLFSGRQPATLKNALLGGRPGTRICAAS